MKTGPYLLFALVGMILLATCADPREENLFDAAQSFVRFNYGNTVSDPARDEVTLDRQQADTLLLPIALSAPPQPTTVRIDFSVSTTGPLQRGENFTILGEDGQPISEDRIQLEPGDFDAVLRLAFFEPLPEAATLWLEITATDPTFILGFPGTGRGGTFKINFE